MKQHIILTLITLFITQQVYGQEIAKQDTTYQLQEVTISYQAQKLSPITYQNISSDYIEARSVGQEPSFLLAETPSVTNYSDAGSAQGYAYVRLRGIDQTRINITFDGVPMNEPEDQGAYFSNYPDIFNSVSRIQIQRGVGTSKNGVANYAGSIQLFSPNLTDSMYSTFGLGYGSFNSFRAFGEFNSGLKNHKAFYARASHIQSDGYKYRSANQSQSVMLSGGLFFDKSTWKLNILAGHQQNEMAWLGVSDSLIMVDRRTNANAEEDDEFTQVLVQLQNHQSLSGNSSLRSSIYYTYLNGNYDFDFNNFLGLPSTEELYNYAFESNLLGFFSNYTLSKKALNWTLGVHGNIYGREHIGSEANLGQLYQNTGFKNELSAFTKADISWYPFTFFVDVQYRYASFSYEGAVGMPDQNWTFFNPKAGLSYALGQNAVLYYSLGRTGREPTRNDMFGGNDDLLADDEGNALLAITSPEFVVDHELGFRYNNQKLSANLNFFYMDFTNEIVLNGNFGPNGLVLTDNVEQSFRTGVELSINYKLNEAFSLNHQSSFNYSRIKEQNEIFSPILTPPLIINQEISYKRGDFFATLGVRFQDQSYIDFANTSSLDAYAVVNARAGYRIKGWQITVFANNLTNSKYFNYGYVDFDGSNKYFVQAPTNFYLSLEYSIGGEK